MNIPTARPPSRPGPRLPALLATLAWLLLAVGCTPPAELSDRVALRLTTREPAPETRFEVVFDDPVARPEDLGVPTASPLRADPPVDGTFVWRGRRTGIFTPSAPLRLGARHVFTLRPDLRDAEGRPIRAALRRAIALPGLHVELRRDGWWQDDDMPARPTVVAVLNAPVDARDLAARARFRDGAATVDAEVEPVPPGERSRHADRVPDADAAPAEVPDGLLFTLRPARPLESTNSWSLEVGPGLRSPQCDTPGAGTTALALGLSRPFAITSSEAVNEVHGGTKVRLRFSRDVPASLATNDPSTWFHSSPAVSRLSVERSPGGRTVAVSGDFALGTRYTVTVPAGLVSGDGLVLREGLSMPALFEPLKPNVWLASFDAVQLAAGRRRLALEAINTPLARVRVKALGPHGLIPALRAYERYLRGAGSQDPDALPGGPLDYAAVAGRTVHDAEVDTRMPVDAPKFVELAWDDLVGAGARGAYFLEVDLHGLPAEAPAQRARIGPQAVVQLTDLGLVTKTGATSTWVWVFSHATGRPVAGVRTSLRDNEDAGLAEATTDADGLARLPVVPGAAWVLAEHGTDLHAERLGQGTVSPWQLGVEWGWEEPQADRVFAFTDREAYRPGERLHLKALARRLAPDGWTAPTNLPITLKVVGPRGDTALRTNLVAGATGSADWSWDVPQGIRGTFRLELEHATARTGLAVEVRDFQPAPFEVALGARPAYGPGDPLSVPVSARYLFGQELARAQVLWSAQAEDTVFAPTGWEAFRFGPVDVRGGLADDGAPPGGVHRSGTLRLESGRPSAIALDLPQNPRVPQPQHVELVAEVTDLDQQTLSRTAEFVRHASAFYLGFRWAEGDEAVMATNRLPTFQVVAVRHDGTPWPGPAGARATLRRVEWKSVVVQRAGRVVGHQYEVELHDVASHGVPCLAATRRGTAWEAVPGPEAPAVFPAPLEPGEYLLEVRAADPDGRPVVTAVGFHVAGDGHLAWHARNGARLEAVADRAEHAPGDTATLLLKAPFDGTALVTVEREDVQGAFAVPVRGNAPAVRVPVGTNASPNVFVGVTLVRGVEGNPHAFPMPEWRVGYRELAVPDTRHRLAVTVDAGAKTPRPGDRVTVGAVVRDAAGRLVPDAEVTLYAVDEGYLVLKGTAVPDPWKAFGEPRRLRVATAVSLPGLLAEDPELRSFGNKGHVAGGGGRESRQRRNFIPCPAWNASLRTGADGAVSTSFTAPDSLTRYRVVAVATHGMASMGSGSDVFEVRKPLMVEPAMPRFAHVGDRLTARALVFNRSGRPLRVHARLVPPPHAALADGGTGQADVDVPADGVVPVDFPVVLRGAGGDEWGWSAEADGLSDAAAAAMPVTHAEPGLREVRHLRGAGAATNLLAGMDPALFEQPEGVTVRVAASPVAFLGEGVRELVHYPYGCVEQTGSSLLPWLALRDLPALLPEPQRMATNVAAALDAGVQRFWTMQTSEGGLAYWPGGTTPQRWGSAYAAWVLALARDAGVPVAAQRLARLHRWLDEQARRDPPDPGADVLHERCLTAFALSAAGAVEPSLLESLRGAADRLHDEDRALLALALLQSGGDRAAAGKLLAATSRNGATPGRFGGGARVLALRLLAQARLDPDGERTAALAMELADAQRGGHWGTTQGNAWGLWALAEFARRPGARPALRGELRLGGAVRSFAVDPHLPVATAAFPLDPAAESAGLVLAADGRAPWFAEVAVAARRPAGTRTPAAVDRGFGLRRRHERLDADNRPGPATGLRVGDRVLVTLEVDAPEDADWVAIEDPLPAVLEAVQGVFKTEATGAEKLLPPWTSDFREVRSDRVLVFRDHLPEGHHVIRYLARVRAAGDAVAAPARVEAMYAPQRHGYSGGARLQAEAGNP